jgi:hypothetical protein
LFEINQRHCPDLKILVFLDHADHSVVAVKQRFLTPHSAPGNAGWRPFGTAIHADNPHENLPFTPRFQGLRPDRRVPGSGYAASEKTLAESGRSRQDSNLQPSE